jgi:hypothetical protein
MVGTRRGSFGLPGWFATVFHSCHESTHSFARLLGRIQLKAMESW